MPIYSPQRLLTVPEDFRILVEFVAPACSSIIKYFEKPYQCNQFCLTCVSFMSLQVCLHVQSPTDALRTFVPNKVCCCTTLTDSQHDLPTWVLLKRLDSILLIPSYNRFHDLFSWPLGIQASSLVRYIRHLQICLMYFILRMIKRYHLLA